MFITGKRAHQNKQHTLTAYSCAFIFVSLASWPMMERNYCISPNTVIKYKFKVLVLYSTSIPLHLRGKYRTFYDSSFVRPLTVYILLPYTYKFSRMHSYVIQLGLKQLWYMQFSQDETKTIRWSHRLSRIDVAQTLYRVVQMSSKTVKCNTHMQP